MANPTYYVVFYFFHSHREPYFFNMGYKQDLATFMLSWSIDPGEKQDKNLAANWKFFLLKWSLLLKLILFVGNGLGLGFKSFCVEKHQQLFEV